MKGAKNFLELTLIFLMILQKIRSMCTWIDHQTCDELCKSDSYWYGHCAGWDGMDFSCKCFDYNPPLSGDRCKEKQKKCEKMCIKQGLEGGFCYPQRDNDLRTNRTACDCFKALPPQLRRKRSLIENDGKFRLRVQ